MPSVFAQLGGAAALQVEHYFSFPVPGVHAPSSSPWLSLCVQASSLGTPKAIDAGESS